VSGLKDSVATLKDDISKLVDVNSTMVMPLGLGKSISDLMKCKICHSMPMSPPLIYARCCKSILGCEKCANAWYNGDNVLTKQCPLCAQASGYNETQCVLGFDDFAQTLKKMYTNEQNEEEQVANE